MKWKKIEHLVQKTWLRTCGRMVLKLKNKKVEKPWDLSWCDDIIREGCGKNLRKFRTFWHIGCLEIKASQRKDRSIEQDSIRFGVKVTVELWFDYKTFCVGNREESLLHVNFW